MNEDKGTFGNRLINLLAVLFLLAFLYVLGRFVVIPLTGFFWTQTVAAAQSIYGQLQAGANLFMQGDTALYCWLGLALYLLPTILACIRKTSNKWPIFLVNVFFGWSVIGWILAFFWVYAPVESSRSPSG